MATTPEGKVKDQIKKILKSHGEHISYFMPAMGSFGKSGVSDFVCCIYGKFVAIEAKHDILKNLPTDLQILYLDGVRKAGGYAWVIDANLIEWLKYEINAIKDKYYE